MIVQSKKVLGSFVGKCREEKIDGQKWVRLNRSWLQQTEAQS